MPKNKTRNRKWQRPPCIQTPQDSLDLAELEKQDSQIYQQQITTRTDYLLTKSAKLIGDSQELIATSEELLLLSEQLVSLSLMLKENSSKLKNWRKR
ncbi:MAG: hypothetical protein AB1861_26080 [Cyanobacteriota bacterium]